jgi:hypothetical protein
LKPRLIYAGVGSQRRRFLCTLVIEADINTPTSRKWTFTYTSASLSFDPENRLTAYGSLLSATYNGDGLRAVKTDSTGTTYYLYDGDKPLVEENSAGAVTATNTFGANGLVSRNAGGSSIFYTFDDQGNVAQRLDSSQNVLTSDLYDSFGTGVSSDMPTDPYRGMISL